MSSGNDTEISTLDGNKSPSLLSIARFASHVQNHHFDYLIQKFYVQSLSRSIMPSERVSKCLRAIVPGRKSVDLIYAAETQSAHYKNLITCGSVWMCPVCAGRITEQRALELQQGVTRWHTEGGFCAMLTFTLRHDRHDNLETVLNALRGAHRRFKAGRSWYTFKEQFSWYGSVTALEVTHGDNGWHPHLHELVFFEVQSPHTWQKFPDVVKERWTQSLAAEGRDATWEHGVNIRDADSDVYEYIAKYGQEPIDSRWTVEREITKAPVKKAREGGRTPFQLLIDYGEGDEQAAILYREYANTFKGRSQLFWSRGLRDSLGLAVETSDDELAAVLPAEYITLASLNVFQWRRVLMLPVDMRGEIIAVAYEGDAQRLNGFLASLNVL